MPENLPSSVEGPSHYKHGNIEPWDFIRDQGLNYHMGCAVKYITRAGRKDGASKVSDLKKAIHYLQNELESSTGAASEKQRRTPTRCWFSEFHVMPDLDAEGLK